MKPIFILLMIMFVGVAQAQSSVCVADDLVPIFELQGTELRSPFLNEVVSIEGVVTTTFFAEDSLSGFFLQDAMGDDDVATSDAVFIKVNKRSEFFGTKILAGDRVQVTGKVLERKSLTQLDQLERLEVCGYAGLLEPTLVVLPVTDLKDWERFEGMVVSFPEPLTVSEVYNLGRYGQVLLSAEGRLFQPNNGQDASVPNDLKQLLLDDASTVENPENIPYLLPDDSLRLGDTVHAVGVIVNYGLDAYKLEPTVSLVFERANSRTSAPTDVGGRVKVAGFNVLNYFTTLNERGADSEEEFARQEAKLVAALSAINADVFGLIEIENNGDEALEKLVEALNVVMGEGAYTFASDPASGAGNDQIRQAFIYKPDTLELVESASDTAEVHDRPPVAATFKELSSGEVFSVITVHFKSKGSCPSAGDLDKGQGCWNLRRAAQAQATLDFAGRFAQATGDTDVLIIGDLNSYRLEDPVGVFTNEFVNLDERLPLEERYTYVFAGESGTLDYAFASPSLDAQVRGFTNWHINSDEARLLDYNLEYNPADIFRPYAFRASDHDPVIIGLELNSDE